VGIKEVDDGIWLVSFMDYDLGYIDLEEKTLQPLHNPFGPRVYAGSDGRRNTFQSVDWTALPIGEPLCPAVLNQTLTRMVFSLNAALRHKS